MKHIESRIVMTRLRIELTPVDIVATALNKFMKDDSAETLHIFTGAERAVPGHLLHARNKPRVDVELREDEKLKSKVNALRSGLTNSAVQLLHLSEQANFYQGSSGNGRLLLRPRDPAKLQELIQLYDEILPNEINGDPCLESFLYVDFSHHCLKTDIERKAALASFAKVASDPAKTNGFHVDTPRLFMQDVATDMSVEQYPEVKNGRL